MLKILIADDDAGDRKAARRALRSASFECELREAASVEEALAACAETAFDCAVLDYHMPGDDGLEGVKALGAAAPEMAIVMVTGQNDVVVASEAIKLGAVDYLPKTSVQTGALPRAVGRAMDKMAMQRKITQQREELESFARILVHDLSAPIRSTCLVASIIEESLEEGRVEEIGDLCRQITRLAKSMKVLIDDLFGYTNLDQHAPFERVDMGAASKTALDSLHAMIDERGARISCDDLPTVEGSAPQIAQLLQNLIGNGVKYCEAPTPEVRVSAERLEEGWLFRVRDNGIGVPEEFRTRIFDRFERLHGPAQYAGSGLGLATCKKIVERHGGRIWCEGAEGGGSVFCFTLPSRALEQAAA